MGNRNCRVIRAFSEEWEKRNRLACAHMVYSIEQALGLTLSKKVSGQTDPVSLKEELTVQYQERIRQIETRLFEQIRKLFRHHLYDYPLPPYSVLRHDLFSSRTWEVLGLTRPQLAAAGAIVGGSVGVVADAAAAGLTFGVFTAIGSALGAGSALLGMRKLERQKKVGGDTIQVGPNENIQLLYILLDRAVLYYTHIVQRAHGKRDTIEPGASSVPSKNATGKKGISSGLTADQHRICARFFKAARGRGNRKKNRNCFCPSGG